MSRKSTIEQGLSSALSPVDPSLLKRRVKAFLKKKGVLVSKDTPKVIERLCRLLNYSITNPKIGGILNSKNILIYPAQTGIGKSVALQHYAAMLDQESSLIVVNTVEEAKEYCSEINEIRKKYYSRGTKTKKVREYAKFYATENTDDDNQLIKKELKYAPAFQCLIVTHEMFKGMQSYVDDALDLFRLYVPDKDSHEEPRNLVVIDERLSFLSKRIAKYNELRGIRDFLEKTWKNSPKFKDDKSVKQLLDSIQTILDVIDKAHRDHASLIETLTIEYALEELSLPIRVDLSAIRDKVLARLDEINDEISLLKSSHKSSRISNLKEIKNGVINTLNTFIDVTSPKEADPKVTHTGGEEVYREFAIYNKDLYKVRSIYNRLGTAVVLDATAEVNSFYKLASQSNSNLDIVDAPKIRKYENLTIHKAQGLPQSANAIFKKDKDTAVENAEWYTEVIKEILDQGDRLLVISFKSFIDEYLEDHFADDSRVVLTNWGKHVGRNDWSDCNKVLIIGWFRLPEEEAISKLFNISSLGTSDVRTMKHVTPEKVKELRLSEIADDLVQGAMRCCARIIATADSDCKPASIYLFQDTLDGSDVVMDLFESQFPQAKILDWKLKAGRPMSTLSKPNQKKEAAIQYLLELSESHTSCPRSDFCEEFSVNKSTLTRWLKDGDFFKKRLNEIGFSVEKVDKKSEEFIFNNE